MAEYQVDVVNTLTNPVLTSDTLARPPHIPNRPFLNRTSIYSAILGENDSIESDPIVKYSLEDKTYYCGSCKKFSGEYAVNIMNAIKEPFCICEGVHYVLKFKFDLDLNRQVDVLKEQ